MERIQVSFHVSKAEYEAAREKARPYFLSVAQWAKYQAFSPGVLELFKTVAEKIDSFPKSKEFPIRECFSYDTWKKIPFGVKAALGRQFYSQVEKERIVPNVTFIGLDSANVAIYRKI